MSVTDRDREKAAVLMDAWDVDDGATYLDLALTIAAALAEEREKARAPFLALADEYEDEADAKPYARELRWYVMAQVAGRIRRTAEVTE